MALLVRREVAHHTVELPRQKDYTDCGVRFDLVYCHRFLSQRASEAIWGCEACETNSLLIEND
jgi:ribosomal protein L37AE/L43A